MVPQILKNERKRLKLTQEQFAKKLGTNRSTVANWENGLNNPSPEMENKIADFLNCTIDYLHGRSKFRNLAEYAEHCATAFNNDLKILNKLDPKIVKELELDTHYSFTPEQIENNNNLPLDNIEILLNVLQDNDLISDEEEVSDKQLKIICEFITNNKKMLKKLFDEDNPPK